MCTECCHQVYISAIKTGDSGGSGGRQVNAETRICQKKDSVDPRPPTPYHSLQIVSIYCHNMEAKNTLQYLLIVQFGAWGLCGALRRREALAPVAGAAAYGCAYVEKSVAFRTRFCPALNPAPWSSWSRDSQRYDSRFSKRPPEESLIPFATKGTSKGLDSALTRGTPAHSMRGN